MDPFFEVVGSKYKKLLVIHQEIAISIFKGNSKKTSMALVISLSSKIFKKMTGIQDTGILSFGGWFLFGRKNCHGSIP
jgi:hypothetical protein